MLPCITLGAFSAAGVSSAAEAAAGALLLSSRQIKTATA
jgi:hypothetical protein